MHLLTLAAFAGIAYAFPYKKSPETSFYYVTEEDRKELHQWKLRATPLMFVLIAAISYLFTHVFFGLSRLTYSSNENFLFIIRPSLISWCFPAIIFAFAVILPVMDVLERRFFKERYDFMQHVYNTEYNWDAQKISRIFSQCFIALSLVAYFLLLGYSAKLDMEHIYYNPLFEFKTRTYSYTDLNSIHVMKDGDKTERFEINFRDSFMWNSGWGLELKENKPLLDFISWKSTQPIDTISKQQLYTKE